jgi:hypothetical protein
MKLAMLLNPGLETTLQKLSAQKVPMKVAFKLKGIRTKIQEEVKKYDEIRVELLKQYGKKDENGGLVIENQNVVFESEADKLEFAQKMVELANVELEVGTLSAADFGDVELTTDELFALGDMLTE